MDNNILIELFKQMAIFSVIISCVAAGIKKTIKALLNMNSEQKLNRFLSIGIVYGLGTISGFLMKTVYIEHSWEKIVYGLLIGAISVLIYEAAVKYAMELIPSTFDKFIGSKNK